MQMGLYSVQDQGDNSWAHSLRTGRLWLVLCSQPVPVGLKAGKETKWTPVKVGRLDSKKHRRYGH